MSFYAMAPIALLTILCCLAGCSAPEGDGSPVLAKVNGIPLTANDVAFRVREAHGRTPQYGEITINDIIDQELLYQKGVKLGLDREPVFRNKLPDLEKKPAGAKRLELARLVFNREIAANVAVRYQEGEKFYQRNKVAIARELHLQMIRFKTRQMAEQARKQLSGGADFAGIARQSMGGAPSAGRPPWDLGFVKWQEVPVDFQDAINRLKPGEVSEPLGTRRTGFQLVRLVEVRRVPLPGYPTISAMVMNRLQERKLLDAYQQYVAQLKKEAHIVTF